MTESLDDQIAKRDLLLRQAHGIDAPNNHRSRSEALLAYHQVSEAIERLDPRPTSPAPDPEALARSQAQLQAHRRRYLMQQMSGLDADISDEDLEQRWAQKNFTQLADKSEPQRQAPPSSEWNRQIQARAAEIITQLGDKSGPVPIESARVAAIRDAGQRPSMFAQPRVWVARMVMLHHQHGWSLEPRPITDSLAFVGLTLRLERVNELLQDLRHQGVRRSVVSRPITVPDGAPALDADDDVIVSWAIEQLPLHRRGDICIYQRVRAAGYSLTWERTLAAIGTVIEVPLVEGPEDGEAVILGPLLPNARKETALLPAAAPAFIVGSEWLDPQVDGDRPKGGRLRVLVADDRGVWLGRIDAAGRMQEQDICLSSQLLTRLVPYSEAAVADLEAQAQAASRTKRRRKGKTSAPGQVAIASTATASAG